MIISQLEIYPIQVQITTTTTTTTTTPAPSTEAGNDTDTTLAPEARRKRSIYSEEELQAMLARTKRAVPSDVLTEGVNKFIPREMMLGCHNPIPCYVSLMIEFSERGQLVQNHNIFRRSILTDALIMNFHHLSRNPTIEREQGPICQRLHLSMLDTAWHKGG